MVCRVRRGWAKKEAWRKAKGEKMNMNEKKFKIQPS